MKHLAINSASTARALDDKLFLRSFLRLNPFLPPTLNLRMFSRLRLIFSFLAFVRDAANCKISRELEVNKGSGANACG